MGTNSCIIHVDEVHKILFEKHCKKSFLENNPSLDGTNVTQPQLFVAHVKLFLDYKYNDLRDKVINDLKRKSNSN